MGFFSRLLSALVHVFHLESNSPPAQSVRLHSFDCAWASKVDGPGLCSTRQVHHGGCCCRRPSQISESRFSQCLDPSTRQAMCGLFVRKLTHPLFCLFPGSPIAWKTSCMHSKRIMHRRESFETSPLRSCGPTNRPHASQSMVQHCPSTELPSPE